MVLPDNHLARRRPGRIIFGQNHDVTIAYRKDDAIMSRSTHIAVGAAALLLIIGIIAKPAFVMGQERFGPAGEHISRSSDLPKGVEDVLRHPSCVYWN